MASYTWRSHIYASRFSVFVRPRDTQLYVMIGLTYTMDANLSFFLISMVVAISTLLISRPLMACSIFTHFWQKKKHLVFTTFGPSYHTMVPKNLESHKNIRSKNQAYTTIKTHISTSINKITLPTKPMRILISQILDQIH